MKFGSFEISEDLALRLGWLALCAFAVYCVTT